MKYAVLISIVSASVYLAGCATPETLYRAEPASDNAIWYSGLAFQTQTKDSVTVSVAFENELEGMMTFYVVVGNAGSQPVLVAPEKISYEGKYSKVRRVTDFETNYVTYDTLDDTERVYAVNPESELIGIDQQVAQANATYANNTGLNVAAGLMQLIGNVATIGQGKTREQRREDERTSRSIQESQMNNNTEYSGQMGGLAGQRAYWQSAALRKTTLFENNAIGGKVRFRVTPTMKELRLIVPVDSMDFRFEFVQQAVPPSQ